MRPDQVNIGPGENPDQKFKEFAQAALQQWGPGVILRLEASIRKQNIVLSEELLNSLRFDVVQGTGQIIWMMRIYFESYGRNLDMKAMNRKRMPPVEEMEKFVQKLFAKNVWNRVPGYAPGKMPSESIATRRLAWAIAFHRKKLNLHKPRKWYARTFNSMVYNLIDTLLAGAVEQSASAIKGGITDGGQNG